MRKLTLATVAVIGVLAAAPALADVINFAQFGVPGDSVANGAHGTTVGGVGFTITGPDDGYTVLAEGAGWAGNFVTGVPLLWDGTNSGVITITFDTPITNISNISVQPNINNFLYTATLLAFNGGTQVGSGSFNFTASDNPGTITGFDVSAAAITSITIGVSGNCSISPGVPCDSDGIAIGPVTSVSGGGVPEPATWVLMLAGIGGLGAALRVSRRRTAAATA